MRRMNILFAGLMSTITCLPLLLLAQSPPKLAGMETPEAAYLQIDRPGFRSTYLLGIASNGLTVGSSAEENRASTTPIPIYVNGSGFLFERGRFEDISHPDIANSQSTVNQTVALKINARGQVAGWRTITDRTAASEIGWVWYKGKFTEVNYMGPDAPGLDPSIQYDKITDVMSINDQGDLIGQVAWLDPSGNAATGWHAWMCRKGSFRLIDPPDSVETYPWDINERGDVVGVYWDGLSPKPHGFLRKRDGTYVQLNVPGDWGAMFTLPFAINSEGDIAGAYVDAPSHPRGFVLTGDRFSKIDVPGSLDTAVFGINPAGEMVGAFKGQDDRIHGFIRTPKRGHGAHSGPRW